MQSFEQIQNIQKSLEDISNNLVIELSDEESEDEVSKYRCLYCNDLKHTEDGNKHSTQYYRNCIKEIEDYKWK